jgi:hypothetical protein
MIVAYCIFNLKILFWGIPFMNVVRSKKDSGFKLFEQIILVVKQGREALHLLVVNNSTIFFTNPKIYGKKSAVFIFIWYFMV